MSALLKKDMVFKWDDKTIKSFEYIKDAISLSPVMISPDYLHDFIIFSFSSQDTIAGVLLQKDVGDHEHSITFMRKFLRDSEMNYLIT
jgi:hypothetical protein